MRALATIFLAILGLKFLSILYESWSAQPSKSSQSIKDFLTEMEEENDTAQADYAVAETADAEDDLGELECDCDPTKSIFGDIPPDDEDETDDDDDDDIYYLPDLESDDEKDDNGTKENAGPKEPIIPIDDALPQGQPTVNTKKEAATPTVESKPATNFKKEGNVIIASDKDFDKVLEEYDYVFVDFFAPWCPHCQALNPHFKKAANKLAEAGSKAVLCKVDITINSKIRKRYNIRNLPTLKLFRKGLKPKAYPYSKVTKQMVRWVKQQTAGKAKK